MVSLVRFMSLLFAGLGFAHAAVAGDFPAPSKATAYSDMALLEAGVNDDGAYNKFLVVYDLKSDPAGSRLAIVKTNSLKAIDYETVTIDWGENNMPRDLETACAISDISQKKRKDKTIEVLVGESGNYLPNIPNQKIFHLLVNITQNSATVLNTFEVAPIADNTKGVYGDQYEGILCKRLDEKNVFVVLGERAGSLAHPDGALRWFNLDLETSTLITAFAGQQVLHAPDNFKNQVNRYIGGLTFCGNTVWAAATYDPEVDEGPFNSAIYQVGRFITQKGGAFNLAIEPPVWFTPGHKVEGIYAFPPDADGNCKFAAVTDDENHGGFYLQQLK